MERKSKYLQIFNYLLEFSKLRNTTIRDIESSDRYPEILWLADVPNYDTSDSVIFPDYNTDGDYWLKVSKPRPEPIFPTITLKNSLKEWVDEDSLTNETGKPSLLESILRGEETLLITNHPEVEIKFDEYVKTQWVIDLDRYKTELVRYKLNKAEYDKKNKIYKQLFKIYNKAQQFGEEYELIIGVGLLRFKANDESHQINRHIFTSKAEIVFETSDRESFITVSAGSESQIKIETDPIIDLPDLFDPTNLIEAERSTNEFCDVKGFTDNIFDTHIKDAIQIFADRMSTDGVSSEDVSKPTKTSTRPTVYFAPALILRKRNTRSLTAIFEKIISNLGSENEFLDIPVLNDLIESDIFQSSNESDSSLGKSEKRDKISDEDQTIYFPKKYNDEQVEIIDRLRTNNKVLVQGPPGTGKSHTIANLICHLLANGKKILVTAYKPRALEVLKNQLPDDFKNLAVNLLSGDAASIQDLEASVNAINEKISTTADLGRFKSEVQSSLNELTSVKRVLTFTKQEYLKVKEQNTWKHRLNANYVGTLSEIAEKIEQHEQSFAWYQDDFDSLDYSKLLKDIETFKHLHSQQINEDNSLLDFELPSRNTLISPTKIKYFKTVNDEFRQHALTDERHILILSNNLNEIKILLDELKVTAQKIDNIDLVFKSHIINDLRSRKSFWQERIFRSKEILSQFSDDLVRDFDRKFSIKYPTDKTWIQLNGDAETLLSHLKSGGSLSGWTFSVTKLTLSKNVREKLYFVDQVRVNGSPCDTQEEFETVLRDIKIKQNFEQLEEFWKESNILVTTNFERVSFYKQLLEEYEDLIACIDRATNIKVKIESSSSIKLPDFVSSTVQHFINELNYTLLESEFKLHNGRIKEICQFLNNSCFHPIGAAIISSIENLDYDNYERNLTALDIIQAKKDDYILYKSLMGVLKAYVPVLVGEIIEGSTAIENMHNLESAILFKNATTQLSKLLEVDRGTSLLRELKELEQKEERLISKIGSDKAWLHILEGLNNNIHLRRHLQAWVQAVKKIGKTGVGKRALKFRKEAQNQMEKCQESVPCWIMPLYKVAETIEPRQGMYDYVIIDEASQVGPDAIFLMYISKNIIIVGDDKQTSPEYIGVDPDLMTPYIKKHLSGIPYGNFYGTETSFFDHAKIFCNRMTVLREHFRCMPEIIEFCNKHFYAPEGKSLYPLKQYSENRLEPLQTVYCQNGYIEGTSQNITNAVDAEEIARHIFKIVKDDRYRGKSIGVIALQGNKQAAIIDNLILQKIGEIEYKRRDIICGNSASFQGDERDIILLSLVTATNHTRAALVKPEDERRFNVAVSRAKEQILLFHSVELGNLSNTSDLRYKLLYHFQYHKPQVIPTQKLIERKLGNQPEPFDSWFEVDVFNEIVAKGYKSLPQYEVAKGRYRIDLVVVLPDGKKIAIECDGDKFHGAEHLQNDMMRQRVLERTGWQFFRVRGGEYYSNRKKALEPLWSLLQKNDTLAIDITEEVESSVVERNDEISDYTLRVDTDEIVETSAAKMSFTQGDLFQTKDQISIDFSSSASSSAELGVKSRSSVFSYPELLVFSSKQNVYKFHNHGYRHQSQLFEQIDFEPGEKPIYVTGTRSYAGYLVVAFENGKFAKISFEGYQTEQNRKKLKNAYSIESKLIFIEHIEEDMDLIAISSIKKLILFNTYKINPVDSRISKGVQVMKPKDQSTTVRVGKLNEVRLDDPEYYRKDGVLSTVGFYLKHGDVI